MRRRLSTSPNLARYTGCAIRLFSKRNLMSLKGDPSDANDVGELRLANWSDQVCDILQKVSRESSDTRRAADKTIAIMSFDKRASSGMLHSSTSEIMRPAPAARLNSPLGSLGAWERNIEHHQRAGRSLPQWEPLKRSKTLWPH